MSRTRRKSYTRIEHTCRHARTLFGQSRTAANFFLGLFELSRSTRSTRTRAGSTSPGVRCRKATAFPRFLSRDASELAAFRPQALSNTTRRLVEYCASIDIINATIALRCIGFFASYPQRKTPFFVCRPFKGLTKGAHKIVFKVTRGSVFHRLREFLFQNICGFIRYSFWFLSFRPVPYDFLFQNINWQIKILSIRAVRILIPNISTD